MFLTGKQFEQDIGQVTSGNYHRYPGGINFSGRFNFADHAAGSDTLGYGNYPRLSLRRPDQRVGVGSTDRPHARRDG